MKLENKNIVYDEKDIKSNFKRLKKYKDKEYIIINDEKDELLRSFINAFNEKDIEKRYNYIYDYMCDYLDKNVCSLCRFKNDRCEGNRKGTSVHEKDGCCYFRNEGFCTLFKDKQCTNPNISCKLFMCPIIEKEMGFKSIPKNYLLLDYFFNRKQKEILQHSYRKLKKDTIKVLINNK